MCGAALRRSSVFVMSGGIVDGGAQVKERLINGFGCAEMAA
jgi:hypothetical protein